MPKYKVKFHQTLYYEMTVEAENKEHAVCEAMMGCTIPNPYCKKTEWDEVLVVDPVQEALDSLNSDQYEVISAELDRLNARIKELEAK